MISRDKLFAPWTPQDGRVTARPLDFPPDLEAKIERHAESVSC